MDSYEVFIMRTHADAKLHAPEGAIPVGICGSVYVTPDKVTFGESIELSERTMGWLLASHILEAREIVWLK